MCAWVWLESKSQVPTSANSISLLLPTIYCEFKTTVTCCQLLVPLTNCNTQFQQLIGNFCCQELTLILNYSHLHCKTCRVNTTQMNCGNRLPQTIEVSQSMLNFWNWVSSTQIVIVTSTQLIWVNVLLSLSKCNTNHYSHLYSVELIV